MRDDLGHIGRLHEPHLRAGKFGWNQVDESEGGRAHLAPLGIHELVMKLVQVRQECTLIAAEVYRGSAKVCRGILRGAAFWTLRCVQLGLNLRFRVG